MESLAPFIASIDKPEHRARVEELIGWVLRTFPQLQTRIAWNQPMFTDHGTFILGLSLARQHLAISAEQAGNAQFKEELEAAGYAPSSMIFRIKWSQPVDYGLLHRIIAFNIEDKMDCATFWRRQP